MENTEQNLGAAILTAYAAGAPPETMEELLGSISAKERNAVMGALAGFGSAAAPFATGGLLAAAALGTPGCATSTQAGLQPETVEHARVELAEKIAQTGARYQKSTTECVDFHSLHNDLAKPNALLKFMKEYFAKLGGRILETYSQGGVGHWLVEINGQATVFEVNEYRFEYIQSTAVQKSTGDMARCIAVLPPKGSLDRYIKRLSIPNAEKWFRAMSKRKKQDWKKKRDQMDRDWKKRRDEMDRDWKKRSDQMDRDWKKRSDEMDRDWRRLQEGTTTPDDVMRRQQERIDRMFRKKQRKPAKKKQGSRK